MDRSRELPRLPDEQERSNCWSIFALTFCRKDCNHNGTLRDTDMIIPSPICYVIIPEAGAKCQYYWTVCVSKARLWNNSSTQVISMIIKLIFQPYGVVGQPALCSWREIRSENEANYCVQDADIEKENINLSLKVIEFLKLYLWVKIDSRLKQIKHPADI